LFFELLSAITVKL